MNGRLSLQSRARGALLGAAIGDALGAPYEGRPSHLPLTAAQLIDRPGAMRYTDDTHMLIGLAESLIECRGFDGAHMARHFARRYAAEPWRGYGAGPPHIFRMIEEGAPWDEAAHWMFAGSGSFGNGGAMRVAPVSLFATPRLDDVARLAADTARITHTHPLGISGTVILAVAIAVLLECDDRERDLPTAIVDATRDHAREPEFRDRLNQLAPLLKSADPARGAARLGNGIAAHESVPTAIFAFLCHTDSFPDAVTRAISFGGDADTIASMTGALAGAWLGEEAIPDPWRNAVEDGAYLRELADRILKLGME